MFVRERLQELVADLGSAFPSAFSPYWRTLPMRRMKKLLTAAFFTFSVIGFVIDLLLLDGAKGLYPDILALLQDRLRPGALILADNADWSPDYLARVRSPAQGYLSVPFAEDVELSMRIG